MIYKFIDDNRSRWTVGKMAKVLKVSPSGYYAWKDRGPSLTSEANRVLVGRIRDIEERHKGRYGSPRVYHELRAQGFPVGHNRIARLMREQGLNCRPGKKFIVTTNSNHHEPVAPNVLDRQFTVTEPNKVWVSDITYLPTTDGWLYLCVVIDLFNRKVVGWSMRNDMTTAIVIDAFLMAVMRQKPKAGLLFHSDRGIQYCAKAFRDASETASPGLVRSMSRKGNCWDNACSESFFKTLKREVDEVNGRDNRGEVRRAIFEYIEVYYNRIRLHSSLGFRTPEAVSKREA